MSACYPLSTLVDLIIDHDLYSINDLYILLLSDDQYSYLRSHVVSNYSFLRSYLFSRRSKKEALNE